MSLSLLPGQLQIRISRQIRIFYGEKNECEREVQGKCWLKNKSKNPVTLSLRTRLVRREYFRYWAMQEYFTNLDKNISSSQDKQE